MYRAETAILDAEQEESHNETSFVVSEVFKLLFMILLPHVT